MTRGEEGEDSGGGNCQGTCIKDTWTKPKRGRIEGRRWEIAGVGESDGGKWRQLYLNNSEKREKYEKKKKTNMITLFFNLTDTILTRRQESTINQLFCLPTSSC